MRLVIHARRTVAGAATIVLVCLLLTVPDGKAQVPVTVKVGAFTGAVEGLLENLANQKGMFKGLKMDEIQVKTGSAMAALLVGQTAHISIAPTAAVLPLIEKGQPIVFLTGEFGINYTFLANSKVQLKHAREPFPKNLLDVKGRTIGVSAPGTVTAMVARKLVEVAGLDPDKDVTYIATGVPTTAVASLTSGRTDFQVAYIPIQQLMDPSQYQMVADLTSGPASKLFEGIMVLGYATTQKVIDEQPETIKAFCDGIWAAYRYSQDPANNEAMITFLSEHQMKLDRAKAAEIWAQVRSKFDPSLSEAKWNLQAKFLATPVDMSKATYAKHVYKPCADPRP